MPTEVITAIIAAIAVVVGASLGALFAWLAQRDTKARERDQGRITALKKEVLARIELEDAAVKWIVDLKNTDEKGAGVKRELRDRVEQATGLRPKMSRAQLKR